MNRRLTPLTVDIPTGMFRFPCPAAFHGASMDNPRWQQRPEGSNWRDFGPDDQIGRMNLLTPQTRLRAVREVQHGLAFCLSLPLDYPGGNTLFQHRKEPKFFHERR